MGEYLAADRRAQVDMARAYERILDAVIVGDRHRVCREMVHHFTVNQRIAKRAERKVLVLLPAWPRHLNAREKPYETAL